MGKIETVMFWDGKRIDTMSREELLEVVRSLGQQVESLQKYAAIRQKWDLRRGATGGGTTDCGTVKWMGY